jgi:hypothetical protein
MRMTHWLMTAMLDCCFRAVRASVPARHRKRDRHWLQPASFALGLQQGNPLNMTRDSVSGETKGWSYPEKSDTL